MFYGDYQFKPAPLVDISREKYVTNNGTGLGGGYRVTLNGTLLPGTVQGSGLTGDDLAGAITLPKAEGHRYDGQANDSKDSVLLVGQFEKHNDFNFPTQGPRSF